MTDIINVKDFYNHETRISIVENAIVSIDKRFQDVDRRFQEVDRRFDKVDARFMHLESKIDSQFKWMMISMGGLSVTVITSLLTFIYKFH